MSEKSLEERIKRLEAVYEIQNIINRYEHLLTRGRFKELEDECWALKTPDVCVEIGSWGRWEGPEGIRRCFSGFHNWQMTGGTGNLIPGGFMAGQTITGVIEIAGDGKTAKGLWYHPSWGAIVGPDGKITASQGMGTRACDFIKEDGQWKMWRYHVYFHCGEANWGESWVDRDFSTELNIPVPIPDEYKPDKPSTYFNPYSKTTSRDPDIPWIPKPYETFDEKTAYA